MWIHQLFFPLVSETNEHVLAGALQALAVICDESQEAVNVKVVFEVDGQHVTHGWNLLAESPSRQNISIAKLEIKRIETLSDTP